MPMTTMPARPASARRSVCIRRLHFKYISPGSLHEDMLLDFIDPSFRYHNDSDASKFCPVAEGVTFLARLDSAGGGESENSDAEAVQRLVRPHETGLVDLYFRIVHPSHPILHKGVFLERYRRMDRVIFLPVPLLAAVYLLAMDWWDYDQAPLASESCTASRSLQDIERS